MESIFGLEPDLAALADILSSLRFPDLSTYRFLSFGELLSLPYHSMGFQTTKIVRKRRLDSYKAKRHQQDRRKESLIKKAYEYSLKCNADVYISIRIKRNGQIFTFNSDLTQEWPISEAQIVRYSLSRSSILIIRNTK
jgi:hypothetical protein